MLATAASYYVKLWNRKIDISKELYRIAEESAFTSTYYGENRHGTLNNFTLEDNPNIVRTIQSKVSNGFKYVNAIKHIKFVLRMVNAEYINPKTLDLSGKVYMIKEKAKEHNLAIIDYLWSQYFKDEVCYKFDMDQNYVNNHIKTFKILMNL